MEKKLNHYDVFEVIDTFDIHKNRDCAVLNQLLNTSGSLTPFDTECLEQARQHLELKWDEWNEEELKMHFISLVFFVARVDISKQIYTFFERRLAGTVTGISIAVIVDCMLASATNSGLPKTPYFFLQEFKRSLGDTHDPEGQMLAAMILAQDLNQDGKPLFGCWVQGRFWFFTTLIGNKYCVSDPLNATNTNDLAKIVCILRNLKDIILHRNA